MTSLDIFVQGVEVQLGFAVDNLKASLAVKRRLSCEHAKVWEEVCIILPTSEMFINAYVQLRKIEQKNSHFLLIIR